MERESGGFAPLKLVSARGRSLTARLVATMVCAAVAGSVLASCGGNGNPDAVSPATTSTRHHATTSTTGTTDPARAAVLQAYRAASRAFEQALSTADPESPGLAATMVDPQLQSVKGNLLADRRQGIAGRGSVTLHPKVVSISATKATVADCVYSTTVLVYQATGKPVPPETPPENDGVTATLVLSGGVWKLSKQTVTDGKCGADA